jgi:branched-chain amino acid transport system substrate-binding protein
MSYHRWIALFSLIALCALATLGLSACGEKEPMRIGYVGSVSGRTADLGIGGRNGVQLAVEQLNAKGGIDGHPVELLLKDDENDPVKAQQVVKELIEARVEAIVGPMTSNMALAVVPLATAAGVLMIAPSVASNDLSGKDDQFFRVIADSAFHARGMVHFLLDKRQVRTLNVVLEMGNKAYTESWFSSFEKSYANAGGKVGKVVRYAATMDVDFSKLAAAALEGQPEGVVLVSSAVDAALFVNQFRQKQAGVQIFTTEWAGTGKLIELGGSNVEGVFAPQYFDRYNTAPAYAAFRDAYRQRFNQEPGFPAVTGFNAVQVVFSSLRARQGRETLKQALLRVRVFDGLQETFSFDDFGDVQNLTFFTVIKDGRYLMVQ